MLSKYYCNCNRITLDKKISYWENKKITTDEIKIINYLKYKKKLLLYKKTLLHVGVGNGFLIQSLKSFVKNIFGISISLNEIELCHKIKNINKSNFYLCDKFSKDLLNHFSKTKFDIIIDNNLKSYSCCDFAFDKMIKNYNHLLMPNGKIIASMNGLKWTKLLKKKISFNFNNFIHYKFKEINGPNRNILKLNDCKLLAKKNNMDFMSNGIIGVFVKK